MCGAPPLALPRRAPEHKPLPELPRSPEPEPAAVVEAAKAAGEDEDLVLAYRGIADVRTPEAAAMRRSISLMRRRREEIREQGRLER